MGLSISPIHMRIWDYRRNADSIWVMCEKKNSVDLKNLSTATSHYSLKYLDSPRWFQEAFFHHICTRITGTISRSTILISQCHSCSIWAWLQRREQRRRLVSDNMTSEGRLGSMGYVCGFRDWNSNKYKPYEIINGQGNHYYVFCAAKGEYKVLQHMDPDFFDNGVSIK